MNPTSPTDRDLDWLAQQYVLGDLPAQAVDQFEARLADDAAACEALARATQLVLSLQAVAPATVVTRTAPPPQRSDRLGRQLVALTAVATCCLVLVLAWSPVRPSPADLQVRAEVIQAKELVNRWRGGRALVAPLTTTDDVDDVGDAGDHAPSWMLAAVSIEKQKPAHPAEHDEVWEDN